MQRIALKQMFPKQLGKLEEYTALWLINNVSVLRKKKRKQFFFSPNMYHNNNMRRLSQKFLNGKNNYYHNSKFMDSWLHCSWLLMRGGDGRDALNRENMILGILRRRSWIRHLSQEVEESKSLPLHISSHSLLRVILYGSMTCVKYLIMSTHRILSAPRLFCRSIQTLY